MTFILAHSLPLALASVGAVVFVFMFRWSGE